MRGYPWIVALAAVSLTACGIGDAEVGDGVPRQNQIDEVTEERAPITGTIDVAGDGCMNLDLPTGERRWVVWPPDAEQGSVPDTVRSGGQEFGDGDAITGVGALVSLADLPGGGEHGTYFGGIGVFCDADESGVVVLDWLELAGG